MNELLRKIEKERERLAHVTVGSTVAQVEATLAVARTNLLVAEAIAQQNALAGGILQEQFGVGVVDEDEYEDGYEKYC